MVNMMRKKVIFIFFTVFVFLFIAFGYSQAKILIKSLEHDQISINIYHDSLEMADNNNVLIDRYLMEPWIIIDGCLYSDEKVVFVILGREGEIRGERLACYKYEGGKFQEKWIYNNRQLNPWKILMCDVEGDGKTEVAVGVWKTAKFHPVFDNRLFIYAWEKEMIYPKWLGSRLSSPFLDFDFRDTNHDGLTELIALEYQKNGLKRIMAYEWTGFGFRGIAILGKNLIINSIAEFCFEGRDFNEIH